MVSITDVIPGSRAFKAGLKCGDTLLSVNGREINDVLDYRFYLADRNVTLEVLRDGETHRFHISKDEYDDIGLGFETPLMDKKHSCENKCVFCFIDQLPKGLRKSLYFKDDDSRLSFLHGNYITLTNLRDKDIDRIIEMHISPVNVSVHTTNPDLRIKMMHNKRAGEVLSYLRRLADAGISLCAQIVLCKNINDGAELERTMNDLVSLLPALKSVSVVPAGLTKFRDDLYPLESFTSRECADVVRQVTEFGDRCKEKYGTRLFFCADEFYVNASLPLPDDAFYEDYAQIENGVGMLTNLMTEFDFEMGDAEQYREVFRKPRHVSVATGYAAYEYISRMCAELERAVPGLKVSVYRIKNNFFGEKITVAGLLTATDIIDQLTGKALGDELIFPACALRADGDVFLDDMTPAELSAALGVKATPSDNEGAAFIRSVLGITEQ